MQSRELLYCVLETNTGIVRHLNQIQWLKPPAGWHKLNTDGSMVSTNGCQGAAGCLEIVLGSGLLALLSPLM